MRFQIFNNDNEDYYSENNKTWNAFIFNNEIFKSKSM